MLFSISKRLAHGPRLGIQLKDAMMPGLLPIWDATFIPHESSLGFPCRC